MTDFALRAAPPGDLRPRATWLGRALLIAVVVSALVAVSTVVPNRALFAKGALALVGIVGVALLVYRSFASFVTLVLAVRSSADFVHAGTVVGAGFLAASMVWILLRIHAGRMPNLSRAAQALLALPIGAVAGAFGAADPLYSLNAAAKLLSVALLFIAVETLIVDRPELRIRFVGAAILAGVAPYTLALLQLVHGSKSDVAVSRVHGTFNHPNVLAMFGTTQLLVAVALWPKANRRLRRVLAVSGSLAGVAVFFTYARAAWIGAVVASLVLLFRYSRRAFWSALGLLALLVLTVPSVQTRLADLNADKPTDPSFHGEANSFAWRVDYWKRIAPGFAQAPLTGLGLEATQRQNPVHLEPHNSYLQVILELGTVGTLCLIWVGREFKRVAEQSRHSPDPLLSSLSAAANSVGLAIAVTAVTENVLTQPVVLWYVVLPFALVRTSERRRPSQAIPASVPRVVPT